MALGLKRSRKGPDLFAHGAVLLAFSIVYLLQVNVDSVRVQRNANRKRHGEGCDLDSECHRLSGLKCQKQPSSASSSGKVCICKAKYFRDKETKKCQGVTELQVKLKNSAKTTTNVTFNWDPSPLQISKRHFIRWGNNTENITTSPSTITNLRPGKTYTFKIVTQIHQAPLYGKRETNVKKKITMNPAMPEPIDQSASQLATNPMTVVFGASDGVVDFYEVTVGTAWKEVDTNKAEFQLQNGREYQYSITANRKGASSAIQRGSFVTAAIKSHGEHCDKMNICTDPQQCLSGYSGQYCLCKNNLFWSNTQEKCLSESHMRVRITISAITTTTVSLSWTSDLKSDDLEYEILWLTPLNETESLPVFSSPVKIKNLTPGFRYTFNFRTFRPDDDFYSYKETKVGKKVDMKPGQPGNVNVEDSQLSTNPMVVTFEPSSGEVAKYSVILIRKAGHSIEEKKTTTTNEAEFDLENGVTYNYKISASNENNDWSEARQGDFTTKPAASSPVTRLNTSAITSESVLVTWGKPKRPSGKISAFVVQVWRTQRDSELVVYERRDSYSNFVMDDRYEAPFGHTVSSLSPFTQYKIIVFAVNAAGNGSEASITFKTSEGVASDIETINVTAKRNKEALQVFLHVQLIPGDQTGETNYSVTLRDGKNTEYNLTKKLTGYQNTSVTFPDLLAAHTYVVSAYAQTKVDSSATINKTVTTLVNIPGKAMNVKVKADDAIATRFVLTGECPSEDERNGTITSIVVNKTSLNDSVTESYNFIMPAKCILALNSSSLGSFKVLHNYSFGVILRNEDFKSERSDPAVFYSAAKPPIFGKERKFVVKAADLVTSHSTIKVAVCVSCLKNESQGPVTRSGLIVCVKSKQKPCENNKTHSYSYATWAQSRSEGFSIPYKILLNDSLPSESSVDFIIGLNADCGEGTGKEDYCNGPLPEGKEVVVRAFSCTSGGCAKSEPLVAKTTTLDTNSDTMPIAIIAAAVGFVFFIVAAVVVLLLLHRRKRSHSPRRAVTVPEIIQNKDTEQNVEEVKRLIPARQFKEVATRLQKDSNRLLQLEFEDVKALSLLVDATTDEAMKETNKAKNRYTDILPYDHSRVKLQVQTDSEDPSDYINASYIPGFNSDADYIATQGPMQATISHFWKMVWEQGSTAIVMLSGLTEKNKVKVSLYWPEILNEPVTYGEITVEMAAFSQLNDTIARKFRISVGDQSRLVSHFFLRGWSDYSANLTSNDVVEFVQLVRTTVTVEKSSAPIVVHCSAGVGRSGTFIALDYFMQYIDKNGLDADVDIFGFVMTMRRNRPKMVQTESQYAFIYGTLLQVIEQKIDEEQAQHIYSNGTAQEDCVYANTKAVSEDQNIYANEGVVVSANPE